MSNLTKKSLTKSMFNNAENGKKLHLFINVLGEKKEFYIDSYCKISSGHCYSLNYKKSWGTQSMNIEKVTDNFIYLYSFDMLGNHNKTKLPLNEITLKTV